MIVQIFLFSTLEIDLATNILPFKKKNQFQFFFKTDAKHLLLLFMGRGEIGETQK